jgi:Flp pilus assembly protein TadB
MEMEATALSTGRISPARWVAVVVTAALAVAAIFLVIPRIPSIPLPWLAVALVAAVVFGVWAVRYDARKRREMMRSNEVSARRAGAAASSRVADGDRLERPRPPELPRR